MKIATHDSATGERGHGFLSWMVTPFSRTQGRTIRGQYEAGCRSYDIRVRETGRGWVCAHGLWESQRTAEDVLSEIDAFADRCQVCVTYEGTTQQMEAFREFGERVRAHHRHIVWGDFCMKYGEKIKGARVEYVKVLPAEKGYEGGRQGFLPLDGRSWHTYVPLPWLWDRLYMRPHTFDAEKYTYVDFL